MIKKISTFMGQIRNKRDRLVDHYVEQVKLIQTLGKGMYFGELSLLVSVNNNELCY